MTIYYLMVKTHNITGLKYLCQTSKQDPYTATINKLRSRKHRVFELFPNLNTIPKI